MTLPTLTIAEVVSNVEVAETRVVVELAAAGPQGAVGPAGSQAVTLTAGQALSALRVVRLDPATGRAVYADATAAADSGLAIGLTLASAALAAPVAVQTAGLVSDPGWAWDVSPGADRRLYLGASGQVVQGPLSGAAFVQPVGVVAGVTSIVVRIGASVLV